MTTGERREVESLMGKLTTTFDGLGRSKRDVQLVLRLNPQWPSGVKSALEGYISGLESVLHAFDLHEAGVARALNAAVPPE